MSADAPVLPGDTARLYHRLSSCTFWPGDDLPPPRSHELVVQDFVSLDRDRMPPQRKVCAGDLRTVDLPREWATPATLMSDVPAGRTPDQGSPLDLAGLGRLLHLSAAARHALLRIGPRPGRDATALTEMRGITLRIMQLPLLVALVYLAVRPAEPGPDPGARG
jgi:hypothetical protein